MTIAAGFTCRSGVLLCTDSEMGGGTLKVNKPKVGWFSDERGGKVTYAVAGHSAFALGAKNKCRAALKADPAADFFKVMEGALAAEYEKKVFPHPDRYAANYNLLFGHWPAGSNKVELWGTFETALLPIADFECFGVGLDLADYLMRPVFNTLYLESQVAVIAAYMLTRVKQCVSGCGGPSQFIMLRNDGTHEFIKPPQEVLLENDAENFHARSLRLFSLAVNTEIADPIFEDQLLKFNHYVRNARDGAREIFNIYRGFNLTKKPSPEPTTGDPSHQPPSPESPGGTGES